MRNLLVAVTALIFLTTSGLSGVEAKKKRKSKKQKVVSVNGWAQVEWGMHYKDVTGIYHDGSWKEGVAQYVDDFVVSKIPALVLFDFRSDGKHIHELAIAADISERQAMSMYDGAFDRNGYGNVYMWVFDHWKRSLDTKFKTRGKCTVTWTDAWQKENVAHMYPLDKDHAKPSGYFQLGTFFLNGTVSRMCTWPAGKSGVELHAVDQSVYINYWDKKVYKRK